jgi:hypothetical protein
METMIGPVPAMLLAAALGGPVPGEMAGWAADGPPARYDAETIFDYIDGHGEVYLAYGLRTCTARRYQGPPGEGGILLDLFEMSSSDDAYGVFTHAREGKPVGVDEESSFGSGTLAFWRGTSFVTIVSERPTERSREAVLALGRAVAAGLGPAHPRPSMVDRLPRTGLDERSVVFLRHPVILSAHLDVGAGNPLGVGPGVPAVLGRYRRSGGDGWTLIVLHRSDHDAEAARRAFAGALLEDGGTTRRGDVWWAAARMPRSGGAAGVAVTRASTRELAESLLGEAIRPAGGER